MKIRHQQLDSNYARSVSLRMPRSTWLAIEACRQEFTNRDLVPYSFSKVMVFLLETYLYEHQQIMSPPVLHGRRARQLSRRDLEDENAAPRQQLAEALNHKAKDTL
jgi:hypothetical protein